MRAARMSSTALFALKLRAYHQRHDDEPKILIDPLAEALAEHFAPTDDGIPFGALSPRLVNVARSAVVVRSRFAEEVLRESADNGPCQYVIVGAGFDTFAHRAPAWAEQIATFEVDHPATQRAKRDALAQLGLPVPENLRYAPADFEQTAIGDALDAAGFNFGVPTVFAWLGVTMYLNDPAVRSTLEFIASLPQSATVVLTFVPTESLLSDEDREALATFTRQSEARGEPFRSRYEPSEVCRLLAECGYGDVRHVAPEELHEQYFKGRSDGLTAPGIEQLIRASVSR